MNVGRLIRERPYRLAKKPLINWPAALPDAGVAFFESLHGIDRFSQLIFSVFSVRPWAICMRRRRPDVMPPPTSYASIQILCSGAANSGKSTSPTTEPRELPMHHATTLPVPEQTCSRGDCATLFVSLELSRSTWVATALAPGSP